MRLIRVLPAALILFSPVYAFAQPTSVFAPGQEATEYVSRTDYFSINFVGQPTVRDITYPTEYRITLPARVYTSVVGKNTYSITVVDYRDAMKIHAARNDKCAEDAGANKPGLTPQQRRDAVGDACQDDGPEEMHGAIVYATWNLVQKATKVTHLADYNTDVVQGNEVHIINPDESRTYATIHMHENRLYITQATVPKNAPAANWFQISLRFLDAQYNPVRYTWDGFVMYANGRPTPRAGQGGGGQRGQQGGQGAQGQGQGRQGGQGAGQGQPGR
jgi:hypothetical protein